MNYGIKYSRSVAAIRSEMCCAPPGSQPTFGVLQVIKLARNRIHSAWAQS